tara:strand:+ start:617 stop:889 length:273 start_codon:yes stop_codon:yes gene_type:complete
MKALLIISALNGMGGYEVEMPSMKECLAARVSIMEQSTDAKTLCVPSVTDTDKMEKFFGIFMTLVERLKELENESGSNRLPSRECSNCEK